jgi:hypothetical protein
MKRMSHEGGYAPNAAGGTVTPALECITNMR